MKTQRVGRVELDHTGIERDLAVFALLPLSTAYSNYLCGGPWLSCALWAPNNAAGNGFIDQIQGDDQAGWTPDALQLPAVRRFIESQFQLGKLKFARLAMMNPGSVIIPHRDLLELASPLHRFHVPLRTDRGSLFAEGRHVFHMRQGEIWSLDASDEHSVLCASTMPRIHLILDYRDDAAPDETSYIPPRSDSGIPRDALIVRPPLTPGQRAALAGLAGLLSLDNHRTVIELVARQLYVSDVEIGFVWATLADLAERAADRAATERLRELEQYFRLERSSGTVPEVALAS